jgi:hypothetical protein
MRPDRSIETKRRANVDDAPEHELRSWFRELEYRYKKLEAEYKHAVRVQLLLLVLILVQAVLILRRAR